MSSLVSFAGEEAGEETSLSFVLDLSTRDAIGPVLQAGGSVYLTLAFSQADDFSHHSIMRTALRVTL